MFKGNPYTMYMDVYYTLRMDHQSLIYMYTSKFKGQIFNSL